MSAAGLGLVSMPLSATLNDAGVWGGPAMLSMSRHVTLGLGAIDGWVCTLHAAPWRSGVIASGISTVDVRNGVKSRSDWSDTLLTNQ
jgi:hypothetical protein